MKKFLAAVSCSLLVAAAAHAADMVGGLQLVETRQGSVLADASGMTLYTFANDSSGKSTCYGSCAETWPPLEAGADAGPHGDFTIVTREDGSRQWAYKGMPLYGWVRDKKPGDVTGHGFRDVWHVAKP